MRTIFHLALMMYSYCYYHLYGSWAIHHEPIQPHASNLPSISWSSRSTYYHLLSGSHSFLPPHSAAPFPPITFAHYHVISPIPIKWHRILTLVPLLTASSIHSKHPTHPYYPSLLIIYHSPGELIIKSLPIILFVPHALPTPTLLAPFLITTHLNATQSYSIYLEALVSSLICHPHH